MKKIMFLILALAVFAFTQNYERCNIPGIPDSLSISTIPDGSCSRENVFVCNVGFNVAGEKSMLYLNISLNAACTSLETSRLAVYENPSNPTTSPSYTTFFLVEDEYEATPLSLTLAGSLAMSASLNGKRVRIIYKKVKDEAYGGIRLQTIEFYGP
ncbi:hypothetical protein SAMN05720472_1343 [Fibrobacter sp. UWR3]|uniref:hypothetical protein n=1 Tax=Fibrobacter sp. UWR3 TaxID=1896217 RepID=UPI0009121E90|nr:hypothetical protein [Fibrobacter sp. UWR3]SHM43177.1 hypothetical protein SAMN05720472_1343 [Fibrobacter sp. UWR3]